VVGLVSSKRRLQAAEALREAEVQADRLRVADVQVAVGFRGKARVQLSAVLAAGAVGENPFFDEVSGLGGRRRFAGGAHGGFAFKGRGAAL
jgi:hypothetical protein